MQAPDGWRLGRRPALDGLRAIAVVAVMLRHSMLLDWLPEHSFLRVTGGSLGVVVFLVISGFLITSLLVEEWDRTGAIDFRAFWIRRALRLMPPLAIYLVALGLYGAFIRKDSGVTTPIIVATLFYVANIAEGANKLSSESLQVGGAVWSLSLEEQFYLLWPSFLRNVLAGRHPLRWVLGIVGFGFAARVFLELKGLHGWTYFLLPPRLDELGAGAALAIAMHRGWTPSVRWRAAVGPLLVAVVAVMYLQRPGHLTELLLVASPIVALLSCGLVIAAVQAPGFGTGILSSRPLVLVGRWSYTIYLFHQLAFTMVIHYLPHLWPPLQFLLGATIAYAVAALMRRFVELPAQRLKHRFDRVPSAGLSAERVPDPALA